LSIPFRPGAQIGEKGGGTSKRGTKLSLPGGGLGSTKKTSSQWHSAAEVGVSGPQHPKHLGGPKKGGRTKVGKKGKNRKKKKITYKTKRSNKKKNPKLVPRPRKKKTKPPGGGHFRDDKKFRNKVKGNPTQGVGKGNRPTEKRPKAFPRDLKDKKKREKKNKAG